MSSTTNTTTTSTATTQNRGGNSRRGRGGRNNNNKGQAQAKSTQAYTKPVEVVQNDTAPAQIEGSESGEEVCWICAEPIKYFSLSECNHRTCHVCTLRLRALYKKLDCTFCKEPQKTVIFTTSRDAEFSTFGLDTMTFKDTKLAIYFETQEMMEETLILLRFNCPDPDCTHIDPAGWQGLKLHVRGLHHKQLCDLCIRSKKVFAHEHALYTNHQLASHLPSMAFHRQNYKPIPQEQLEGGVHPLCEFCRECFFGDDELFSHMRERHEECFVCKGQGVRDQYFNDYKQLERHFNSAHHPCTQAACLAQKFVVFGSSIDLKAHMVEEHGADMTSRDKKDTRRVQADFEFEEVNSGRNRQRPGQTRTQPQPQQHQPQPPPPPLPGAPATSSRPPGGGNRRREAFGTGLTNDTGSGTSTPRPGASTPSNNTTEVDPATLERHTAFLSRLQRFTPNSTTAVPVVKSAVRTYRASESSSRDLITTIWNVLDSHMEHTANIVNALVDLFEDEEKKTDVLRSWKTFELEQRRQFPELIPTSVGSEYAGIASGRVLNAKQSTNSRSARTNSRRVWDRVAQAANAASVPGATGPAPPVASSSSMAAQSFPALATTPSSAPGRSQAQRSTPWASGAGRAPAPVPVPTSVPAKNNGPNPNGPPPKLSSTAFPGLPPSENQRVKVPIGGNKSLKNIVGTITPPVPAWQAGGGSGNGASAATSEDSEAASSGAKGKKGKGKQKQTLFTTSFTPA